MAHIFNLEQIKSACKNLSFMEQIERGFAAYSRGEVIVPPVGELSFKAPPGDTHIKYGYIKNSDSFVIKIASGFYDNPKQGLPSNSGLMLVFSQKTGVLQAVLLDEGYLTDVRTAVAGQIAAKYLAPSTVSAIGILGTGIQARMQVSYLKEITSCRQVVAWGRSDENLFAYKEAMENDGFQVQTTTIAAEVAKNCNLLITATPSQQPLLLEEMIQPGTHITAMGSDTSLKQELDTGILQKADLVVADSIPQCLERGEISKALLDKKITAGQVIELGNIINGNASGRSSAEQITVADLTGVAVQDMQIAKAVCAELMPS
jgi:ornithine cyclodeaminase